MLALAERDVRQGSCVPEQRGMLDKAPAYQAGGLPTPAGGLPFGSGKPPTVKFGRVLRTA